MLEGSASQPIKLEVNGQRHEAHVTADDTLVDVLRGQLHLSSCRETCGLGLCGSCTVIVDDRAVNACLMPAFQTDGATVRTAEGLANGVQPSALQQAFIDHQAFQCSFCTPGFLMSATALMDAAGGATVEEALSGHICRCGSYEQILHAVKQVCQASGVACGGCSVS